MREAGADLKSTRSDALRNRAHIGSRYAYQSELREMSLPTVDDDPAKREPGLKLGAQLPMRIDVSR